MFMNVDLPEPEGPMIATKLAFSIERETPRSASTRTSPMKYVFVSFSTLMSSDICYPLEPRAFALEATLLLLARERAGGRRARICDSCNDQIAFLQISIGHRDKI